jgi:hypothetical protein
MLNCRVIFINGPINSGKTTIGKLLSEQAPEAVFLDGDEIVSQEGLDRAKWIVATVMTGTLRACELAHEGKLPIIAFPLRDSDWKVITGLCNHAGVTPICVTLDPGIEVATRNRGARQLNDQEIQRIEEMYKEGYHERAFSSVTLKNSNQGKQETCDQILSYLRKSEMH